MLPVAASKKLSKFDPKTFLSTINGGRKIEAFPKKQTVFAQGDSSDAVFYIHKGKVKLTVVSQLGKEATIGILNEGDFFGEGEKVALHRTYAQHLNYWGTAEGVNPLGPLEIL